MAFPKIEGYVVTEKLGSGSYSTVYKAYAKVGARSIVAVKCVDKSRIKNSGTAVDNLITEIRLLKTLTHPHIVHMKHFTWDDKNIYIIMEYCCGGDLSKYIQRYGRVPEKQVLYFLQQLASALKFLREKDVVHMDLKPHNLLLHKGSDGKYTLKVADFGFAQYICASESRGVRGSPLYMAPEMLRGNYDARVDLWSVGVIMYECLFGRAPYSSNTFKELVDKIQNQAKIQIPPNSSISPACRELLTRLLQHDPDQRISYEEFFNHEYLDLEHMPSKDNYEKAVSMIKRAIELDSMCEYSEAFTNYRDALRYLVPCVSAETDAVRRGALADKLTRYMERAEELKQYLNVGSSDVTRGVARATPAARDVTSACCASGARATNTRSYEYGRIELPVCACTCVQTTNQSSKDSCSCSDSRTEDRLKDTEPTEDKDLVREPNKPSANVRSRTPPRFGFKRLFGRNTMPYLTNNDSSMTGNTTDKQKVPVEDSSNGDGCRIT